MTAVLGIPPILVGAVVGYLAGGAVAMGLGWQALRGRSTQAARLFAATMVGVAIWSVAYVGRLLTPGLDGAFAWTVVAYLGVATVPVGFVLFAASYAGYGRYVTRTTAALLLVVPAATLVALITTPLFDLYYESFGLVSVGGVPVFTSDAGPWFWVQLGYSYVLLLVGTTLLVRVAVRHRTRYRVQAAELAGGVLLPWGVNVALVAGVRPHPAIDFTPVGFAVGGVLLALAIAEVPLTDVTPVARSAVVDAMHDGVVVVDTSGIVVDANDAACRLLGAGLVGRRADDALPASMRAVGETPELVELSVGGHRSVATTKRESQPRSAADLSQRWYRVQWVHVDRGVDALLFSDATGRERNRRQLERQTERLEEFTAAAAHDLRNPLNVVEGYVDLAREDPDIGAETATHLDRIDQSAERMRRLVEDLLALGQRGQLVEEPQAVDLAAVVEAAWRNVHSPEATLVPPTGTVYGDPARIQQLFESLFRNAVEHGGDDVTVTVERYPNGFAVGDDGPGIPLEAREDVFEYGYSTSGAGSGFGLSIVQIIADAHGWTVSVTCGAAGGCRFEFSGVRTEAGARDNVEEIATAYRPKTDD